MITRTFKLCLNAGTGSAPYINVSQYDEGETWLFELYSETGERYIPTTGAIVGVKSDGHGIVNTGTVDSEGRVVITETQQMTASAGRAIFELSIDGLTHGTANFIVAVERKPTDDAVMSDSDLSLIQEAIDSAEVIVEVIGDGDPSEVIGEHVDAWLDNHPEATTTVQDGAITAPKINQSLWDKLLVSEEASGAVASFEDGADDVPVSSLKVALEPIQTGSGDPSPTNVRPITGHTSATVQRTGKNLFDYRTVESQTKSGITLTNNNDGSFTLSGTATNIVYFDVFDSQFSENPLPYGTYTMSGCPSGGSSSTYSMYVRPSYTKDFGNGATFTNSIRGGSIVVYSGQTLNNLVFRPQIEIGSTATHYEPYQGQTVTIDLNGTVYGGTVDLATGVLKVTHKTITLTGTQVPRAGGIYANGCIYSDVISDMYNDISGSRRYEKLVRSDTLASASNVTVPTMPYSVSQNTGQRFVFNLPNITTVTAANDWLTEHTPTFYYELATPQTIQLTPTEVKTMLGYNNISSSGTVEVIYHADTKLYVDKMTAVDNAIIAPTEADFVATRNYTVNDLVIVADTLYKVTANIATGSAITPNSNVTQTTLGALIKALS